MRPPGNDEFVPVGGILRAAQVVRQKRDFHLSISEGSVAERFKALVLKTSEGLYPP